MRHLKSRFIKSACMLALASVIPVPRSAGATFATGQESQWRGHHASVTIVADPTGVRRRYRFTTDMPGAPAEREVAELAGPWLRSGSILFDGLFALALDDERLDTVGKIRDEAFNAGRPIDCVCFETGEKWHYVWTRDVSYAVDLALASLDPERSLNSLLFKTSGVRSELAGSPSQPVELIAQDTGSGGSWPVSTDRVVWILAANDVLESLPPPRRAEFSDRLFRIARDTLEQDRQFAFDVYTGLYRGETSFLDWREQNYPSWTRNDVAFIASGYALSTNVLHVIALEITAQWAERRHDPNAPRYRGWARDLEDTVNRRFWRSDSQMYASYLGPEPNSTASPSYDLLGLSLAIIGGIAGPERARAILQRYPLSAAGPPVLWPQQPAIAIYHNRAIWPFVTAYALRAAKVTGHAALAGELGDSLVRGAALSLSNMENFEFLTQQTRVEDGSLSGPVINSPRQLWSVAGYLDLVVDTLWGLRVHDDRVSIKPWLPGRFAHDWFGVERSPALHDWRIGGSTVTVTLTLPPRWPNHGWLAEHKMWLNGRPVAGTDIALRDLAPDRVNEIRVSMRAVEEADQPVARITDADFPLMSAQQRRGVYAPAAPTVSLDRDTDGVTLSWPQPQAGDSVDLFKNGRLLASRTTLAHFVDNAPAAAGTVCYSAQERFEDTGLVSSQSRDACVFDQQMLPLVATDGALAPVGGEATRFADWGAPTQELASRFVAGKSGWYRIELQYANPHGPINTGITAAVKRVTVRCANRAAQPGSVVMPHSDPAAGQAFSSGFFFQAQANDSCEVRIVDGFNMSYLSHFARYTGGQGGSSGALNRADIAGARVDFIPGAAP